MVHICGCTNHGAEGDKADEGVGRQETQADDDSIAQGLEVFFIPEAGVDNKEKDRWNLGRSGKRVFDGGVFWEQFGGQVGVGDIFVVWWEGVPLQTEGANPELSADINLAEAELM